MGQCSPRMLWTSDFWSHLVNDVLWWFLGITVKYYSCTKLCFLCHLGPVGTQVLFLSREGTNVPMSLVPVEVNILLALVKMYVSVKKWFQTNQRFWEKTSIKWMSPDLWGKKCSFHVLTDLLTYAKHWRTRLKFSVQVLSSLNVFSYSACKIEVLQLEETKFNLHAKNNDIVSLVWILIVALLTQQNRRKTDTESVKAGILWRAENSNT